MLFTEFLQSGACHCDGNVLCPGEGQEPSSEPVGVNCVLPKPVMDCIERDNANFEDWIQDIVLTQVVDFFALFVIYSYIRSQWVGGGGGQTPDALSMC